MNTVSYKKTQASFSAALRGRREAARLSQAELARKIGVSSKSLSNIEAGHNLPSLPVYAALCAALRCGRCPLLA